MGSFYPYFRHSSLAPSPSHSLVPSTETHMPVFLAFSVSVSLFPCLSSVSFCFCVSFRLTVIFLAFCLFYTFCLFLPSTSFYLSLSSSPSVSSACVSVSFVFIFVSVSLSLPSVSLFKNPLSSSWLLYVISGFNILYQPPSCLFYMLCYILYCTVHRRF
jgi:hypothetical protein